MTDNPETLSQHQSDDLFRQSPAGGALENGDEGEKIDVAALLRSLKAHWRWPVGLAGAGAVLAVLITLFSVPVFVSTGSIYLGNAEKDQGVPSGGSGLSLLAGLTQAPNMETQIQIMQSRDIIERAIARSGLNVSILSPSENNSVHFWYWLASGHSFGIYAPPGDGLHASLVKAIGPNLYGARLDLIFTASGHYRIQRGKQVLLTGILGEPAVAPTLRLVLQPNVAGFVPKAGSTYHLTIQPPLAIYKMIRSRVSVAEAGENTGGTTTSFLVNLAFQDANPYTSQHFLNTLMLTYLEQTHAWATGQASSTYDYLNVQLEKIRTALETADNRLAGYQSKSGVLSVASNAQVMISQMATYESQLSALKLKLYSLQRLRRELNTPGDRVNPYLVSSVSDPVLNGLSEKLITAQGKEAALRNLYTPAAPEMRQIMTEIDSIKSAIRNVLSNQETETNQRMRSLSNLIGQYKEQMGHYPQEALQVLSLTRSSEVLGKLYMFLMEKQEEAAISKASTITKNRILDTALVHDLPVSPVGKRNVLVGAFLGLLSGLGVVFWRFLAHKGFHSDEEIRRRYASLPLFGTLPEYTKFSAPSNGLKSAGMTIPDSRSGYGEAMRLLRGKLYMDIAGGEHGRVLMLTSAVQGDGKSTVATQLAMALAKDGKSVLLIDADLRNPHLHEVFRTVQSPGLAGYLAGQGEWRACVQSLTGQPDLPLQLIAAGEVPPSPVELVGQPRFAELIDRARREYDYIVLDTPPFPMVSDGLVISRMVDRVLSVIRVGQTPRRAFQEHVIGVAHMARPRGLVINGTSMDQGLGYSYTTNKTALQILKDKMRVFVRRMRWRA
ncbi:GumC family protein [Acidithiobacillus ferrianus]|uniref:GumC family protein n=1 Tax=Acidithiobacillus ferrianus TaxID=2678518 RepID=UPI0034E5F8EA